MRSHELCGQDRLRTTGLSKGADWRLRRLAGCLQGCLRRAVGSARLLLIVCKAGDQAPGGAGGKDFASKSKWCENRCGSAPVTSFTRPF